MILRLVFRSLPLQFRPPNKLQFFLPLTIAEPAGSISMVESEQFDVIEYDQGDGWTRVRRKHFNPDDEDFIGFVPTTYIAIEPVPET